VTQQTSGLLEVFQNLDYQQYDEVGNITNLIDSVNGITHVYTYD